MHRLETGATARPSAAHFEIGGTPVCPRSINNDKNDNYNYNAPAGRRCSPRQFDISDL